MISLKIESKPKFILLLIRLRCSCLETRWSGNEDPVRFSERPTGGV